jgi:hypothetical protein
VIAAYVTHSRPQPRLVTISRALFGNPHEGPDGADWGFVTGSEEIHQLVGVRAGCKTSIPRSAQHRPPEERSAGATVESYSADVAHVWRRFYAAVGIRPQVGHLQETR